MEALNQEFGKTIVMVTHDPRAAHRAHKQQHLDKGVLTNSHEIPALHPQAPATELDPHGQHGAGDGGVHLPVLHAADGARRRSTYSLQSASASRLWTRHAVSLVFTLPLSYEARIATVPGVVKHGQRDLVQRHLPGAGELLRELRGGHARVPRDLPGVRGPGRPEGRRCWPIGAAASSAEGCPRSSAGRSATPSSWRARSRRTASAGRSSSWCARSTTPTWCGIPAPT